MIRYRTGIIGLGRIGFTLCFDRKREQPASHSAAFSGSKRILLDGGYDSEPERMREWTKFYKSAGTYSSLEEMLADGRWDIIVIAVPERYHYPVFMKTVKSKPGLIVIEKPVAPTYSEAFRMKIEASRLHVPVLVNHERRFSRDYILLRQIINEHSLGDTVMVICNLFTPSKAWGKGDWIHGNGAMIRDGTHLFDSVNFLLGKRIEIDCSSVSGRAKNGSVKGISCLGRAGKTAAAFNIGFETRQFMFEIDIIFKTGRAVIGNGILEIKKAKPSPYYEGFYSLIREGIFKAFRRSGYFSGMVNNCVGFLDGKNVLLSTIEDGIDAIRCIDDIGKLLHLP